MAVCVLGCGCVSTAGPDGCDGGLLEPRVVEWELAACSLWSSALSAMARLLSASARALPGVPRCRKLSPRAADTSACENGVQTRTATSASNTWSANAATKGLTGLGKNSAKANVSLASPRSEAGCEDSKSGNTVL